MCFVQWGGKIKEGKFLKEFLRSWNGSVNLFSQVHTLLETSLNCVY